MRPRISMIEQKLQSNVQPREVSTTSTGRPEQRVALEDARPPIGQGQRLGGEPRHRPVGVVDQRAVAAVGQAGDVFEVAALLERPQQRSERVLAFASHERVDGGCVVGLGREAGIVAAGDDVRARREAADQRARAARASRAGTS